MSAVWLVRHPTPAIAPGICYGASDIAAEPQALQAAIVALDAQLPADALLLCSPLIRCTALARALCALRPTRSLVVDARLAERHCGAWELQAWDDVPRAELDAWALDFLHYAAPGVESVAQLQARVLQAWAESTGAPSQPLVWITHAGPIQVVLAHSQGRALSATPLAAVACGSAISLNYDIYVNK